MHNIKNIIFDLGGVILSIDYKATEKEFRDLGLENFDDIYSQAAQTDIFNRLETGELSESEFLTKLKACFPEEIENGKIEMAWNAMLGEVIRETIALIKSLRPNYKLFLLSNTNEIHYRHFSEIIEKEMGMKNFKALFERDYYSHELGMRKPNPQTFLHLCEREGLNPSETLFIDDSIQHIRGAEKAGLITYHKLPSADWEEMIDLFELKLIPEKSGNA